MLCEFGCPKFTVSSERIEQFVDGTKKPYLAIAFDSEEPTREEVTPISVLIPALCARHGGKPGTSRATDADTFIIRKAQGGWTFKRAAAATSDWKPVHNLATLADII